MFTIAARLATLRSRILEMERRHGRAPGSVRLIAVSKTKPASAVREACAAGQHDFGENQLQDALGKIEALSDLSPRWHFIGSVQSNKTRDIAARFDWVQSVDRARIAARLDAQRPPGVPALNVCIQVNVSAQASKSGVTPDEVPELARYVRSLTRLRLRGLMAIPRQEQGFEAQRGPFRRMRVLFDDLNASGFEFDTLSIGMSDDLEAAIAEGATMVRIGTAIFGSRGAAGGAPEGREKV